MIKVESITIKEFRGIRDLTLPLKGKSYAICGHNGTGKSGIVDALEFALTGNISRLRGQGMGSVSLKEHAPHVDSRNRPDRAEVILDISIPSIGKKASIKRTVDEISRPVITPNDPDVVKILNQVSLHPEFVLTRREIIKYVLSAPGDRAKEIQALLRLDEVEELRTNLFKIANSFKREEPTIARLVSYSGEQLTKALEITSLDGAKIIEAVNKRRTLLGLQSITILTATTSLKDGLSTARSTAGTINRISKPNAIQVIESYKKTLLDLSARKLSL